MTILQALILGIVQGLTEFLPVSSSGHLIFVPHIFGWADQGLTFDVIVHLGTLVAVVWYFRNRIVRVFRSFLPASAGRDSDERRVERQFGWMIALSIIPAFLAGFFLSEVFGIEMRSPLIVALGFIVWGIVLGIADAYNTRLRIHVGEVSWKTALFMGVAQAIALIPGTSRSGITMTAGLFSKLTKKQSAEFSFLMSVPVIVVAGVLKIVEMGQTGGASTDVIPLVVGFFASMFSGYVAIWGLLKVIEKWRFLPFVFYRIVMGILIIIFLV